MLTIIIILLLIPFFFFNAPAPTDIYTLSLHDALPISFAYPFMPSEVTAGDPVVRVGGEVMVLLDGEGHLRDRKSTRLNSSHVSISYAVFCLKKKNSAEKLSFPN